MNKYLVEVAPAIPLKAWQRQTYTYYLSHKPPEEVLHRIVTISFGPRRRIKGVIMKTDQNSVAQYIKPAELTTDPPLTLEQVAFGQWIAHTMHGGVGFTLRLFMP